MSTHLSTTESGDPQNPPGDGASQAPPPGGPRDAIIYISGLNRSAFDQSIDTIVHKLTGALERQAPARLRFNWIGGKTEEYGPGHQAPVRTITVQRLADQASSPLADVYELDYSKTLSNHFDESSPLLKVLKLPLYVAPMIWPFLGLWVRKRMSAMEIAQLLVLTFIASLILLFTLILAFTASVALLKIFGLDGSGWTWLDQLITKLELLIVTIAGASTFGTWSIRQAISMSATEFVCVCSYLRFANRKPAILGQALALLEHIAEKPDQYRSVQVLSYSFGSIIALDLLFPHDRPGARLEQVKNLTTIGCPFDLVRGLWPDYFEDRQQRSGRPVHWLNIFSPVDVFGSSFSGDDNCPAARGIVIADAQVCRGPDHNVIYSGGMPPKELSLWDVVTLLGIRAHSMYWMPGSETETNCFDAVVNDLYEQEVRRMFPGAEDESAG